MGKPTGIPSWHQGKKMLDDISGEEIYERSRSSSRQALKRRGLTVCKASYDSLTNEERNNQINKRRG